MTWRSLIKRVQPAYALTLLCVLQGCALKSPPSGENVRSRVMANARIPQQWQAGQAEQDGVESGWLAKFDDPLLSAFVTEALAYNADLRIAAARVEQAAAHLRVAQGELSPAVTATGRGGEQFSGGDAGLEGAIVSASWELDLWGRIRYGVRGSQDQYFAVQADYAFARQSLVALVAKSWFLIAEASAQHDLASENVVAASRLVELAESRSGVGIGSEVDVASAKVALESYRDNLLQIDLARAQSLRSLELLLGRYPSAAVAPVNRLPALTVSVPAGLPSDLLERRPDVMAAERRVNAAFNRVQQARAARLPRISLTGGGSSISSDVFVLQDRDNPVWSAGGSVFAPLFSGGALRAQVDVATAEQERAMVTYADTALRAFGDVENALSSERVLLERESVLSAAVVSAERALRLAETRYRVGSGDLRPVQQQQLAYHAARISLLRVQSERRIQRINLHLALGGDFS